MQPTITCGKCGAEKPADAQYFLRDNRRKSGFREPCKTCRGIKKSNGYGGAKPTGDSYQDELRKTRERHRQNRLEMIAAYGGKCVCCGETEVKFLNLDHTNEDGNQHRAQVGRANSFSYFIRRQGYPKGDLQLLCANCHQAKSYHGGCPHQVRKLSTVVQDIYMRAAGVAPESKGLGVALTDLDLTAISGIKIHEPKS